MLTLLAIVVGLLLAGALANWRNDREVPRGLKQFPRLGGAENLIPILMPVCGRPRYLARVLEALAGVKGIVGEHDAGRKLEQVDVGRRLVQAVPSGEWGARLDQGEARVAEAMRVGGVGLVTFAEEGVAAGTGGALSLAGERHDAVGG